MALHWPDFRAYVHPKDVPEAAARMLEEHKRRWGRHHRSLMRYYAKHQPGVWEKVSHCRHGPIMLFDSGTHNKTSVTLPGCGIIPWCPSCNNEAMRKRAYATESLARDATPTTSPQARYWIIEMGPAGFRGRTWETWAMDNHREYMTAQWRVIQWMYGETVGAAATFQPYGTSLWTKPHPHVHWYVHGWQRGENGPKKTPQYWLKDGGRDRWRKALSDQITSFTDQYVDLETIWVDIQPPKDGGARGALRYQYRELIDPAAWIYHADQDKIEVRSYKDNIPNVWIDVTEIHSKATEYGIKYGVWARQGGRNVDQTYGDFSPAKRGSLQTYYNGGRTHKADCLCGPCASWSRPRISEGKGGQLDPEQRWA